MSSRGWLAPEALSTISHTRLLDFLEIPGKCRKLAFEQNVLASVRALYFMHQELFGGLYGRCKAQAMYLCDTSNSENTEDEEQLTTPSRQL